jgi:transcription elongation factor Elf1
MATTTSNVRATAKPARRGFPGIICPFCGKEESVSVRLDDMTGDDAFSCRSCDTTWSRAWIEEMIGDWLRVLDWCDLAPEIEE